MGAFAFLLRALTWWQAALLAGGALLFNLLALPRLGGHALYRPTDVSRGLPIGILLYPLAVLILVLLFPRRLDIVAAAWGIMAAGDGFATIVGRQIRSPRLPWNQDKTVAGTLAFVVAGSIAAMVLSAWTRTAVTPPPPFWFVIAPSIVAAAIAGLIETIPIRLDDNISVPGSAAVVLWAFSLVHPEIAGTAWSTIEGRWLPSLGINVVLAWMAWRAGTVSVAGALTGAVIGIVIYLGTGPAGWIMLFAAFAAAAVSSKFGWERKSLLGIAEDRGGRRGPGNAIANCGVAACAALLALFSPYGEFALLALVTALTAGASDTVASEVGKARGRRTFLITRLSSVKPGTSGAISLEGTAAGFLAALALSALGVALGLMPLHFIWISTIASTVGAFAESALGATLEGPGIVNNDVLNFLNTLIAAGVAIALAGGFS